MRWLETNVATCLGSKQATGLCTWLCLRPLSPKHSAWEFLTSGSFTKSSHVLPRGSVSSAFNLDTLPESASMNKCAALALALATKPGTLPAPWACQSPPTRRPLLTSMWPLSAHAASQAQRPQLPSLASLLLPAFLAPQPAPGLPALGLMSAPSQLQALATVARGHFPHQHQALRAKTASVNGLTMWPWNRQRIKSRTQGREFPLLRPGSDPLMTQNCPRISWFQMAIKTLTVNVRGLGNHIKQRTLFQFFKKEKCDIICLQETHITSKCADTWKRQWCGDFYISEGSSHGKGQIIMINKKLRATHCQQLCNGERILGIKFNVDDKTFYVFNVYGPSTEDERTIFFSQLEERCRVSVEDNAQVIIAGDFNEVSSNDLDIISGNPHNAKSVDSFNATMAKLNAFDCWRLFHSDEKQYIWNRNNPFLYCS